MFLSAFILGLAGSLHCAGMCSPLAFAVTRLSGRSVLKRLIYNIGRILVYSMLGMIVSSIGVVLPFNRFQTGLSIGMGVLLIVIGVMGVSPVKISFFNKPMVKLSNFIKLKFGMALQKRSVLNTFLLGMLNGLLPCGLTFMALATCVILPSAIDGAYFMLVFGLGTLPVMIGMVSLVTRISSFFKISYSRLNTGLLIIAGCFLLTRPFVANAHSHSTHSQVTIEVCEQ